MRAQRVAERNAAIAAIASAARTHGAVAFHLSGSLGRGDADAFSDIDAWLTFPDEAIDQVVFAREDLFGAIGRVLLVHEMAPNRPPGGVYALVLYEAPSGPLQVDWQLAPRQSSRIDGASKRVFADISVPAGERPSDPDAEQATDRTERITWLIAMLFVTIKMILRGNGDEFLAFLATAYRDIGVLYGLDDLTVSEPVTLANVRQMFRQLDRHADESQRLAIQAIDDFLAILA